MAVTPLSQEIGFRFSLQCRAGRGGHYNAVRNPKAFVSGQLLTYCLPGRAFQCCVTNLRFRRALKLSKFIMQNEKSAANGSGVTRRGSAVAGEESSVASLFDGRFQVGAGVYDGLSALLAAKWKFDFVWVSSFCCSAAAGLPDVGIIGADEILSVIRCVKRSIQLPIVVDIDAGYGDAVKAFHVVEAMARAGAAALCIEDNPISKRCSLYDGYERELVSIEEHSGRLRAARAGVEAAHSDCRIIARTEAMVAGMGVPEALKRAAAYVDAGAHGVFVQSLDATGEEVLSFAKKWNRRTPLFIAPTRLPNITKKDFESAGVSHSIFANQGLRAAHAAMDKVFEKLSSATSAEAVNSEISSVATVANLVGSEKVVELEALFAGPNVKPAGKSRSAVFATKAVRNGHAGKSKSSSRLQKA
jgi:phosphoenolpyruvate phosphomutase